MAELNINIGANVNNAIAGLKQVETQTQRTFQKVSQSSGAATQSMINLSRVVQDAPYGFIGIANNLNPLLESFQRLKEQSGTTGAAFKQLASSLIGPAGIGLAVGVVSSLLVKYGDTLLNIFSSTKALTEEQKKYNENVKNAISSVTQEAAKVETLVAFIKLETTTKKERNNAIKELQSLAPGYFANLNAEKSSIKDVTAAYDNYLLSLRRSIEARVIEKELQDVIAKRLELEKKLNLGRPVETAVKNGRVVVTAYNAIYDATGEIDEATKELNQTRQKELDLAKQLAILQPPKLKAEDFKVPKVKQDKPLDLVFQPIVPDLTNTLKNPIIQALKSPDILSESQQIAKLINDSIEKNVKPLSKSIKLQEVAPEDLAFAKQYVDALGTINEAINSIQIQGLASLGEAIGAAFSGGSIGNVFKSFVETIAMGITAIGKQLITLGIAAQKVQVALKSLFTNPIAMIAAGVGLIAVGSAIRGALSSGIEGRANGGPVSGQTPYIIGERGPELFVPSVAGSIIPNNRMGSFSGRSSMGSSGGGRSIVRGNDILLAYARTSRSQNRVNA